MKSSRSGRGVRTMTRRNDAILNGAGEELRACGLAELEPLRHRAHQRLEEATQALREAEVVRDARQAEFHDLVEQGHRLTDNLKYDRGYLARLESEGPQIPGFYPGDLVSGRA
jgi:hypothetical protein